MKRRILICGAGLLFLPIFIIWLVFQPPVFKRLVNLYYWPRNYMERKDSEYLAKHGRLCSRPYCTTVHSANG